MTRFARRIGAPVLLVVAWALLATSCGNEEPTKEEYGDDLRGVMADLETAWGDAGAVVSTDGAAADASTEETVGELERSQLALRDAANRLDEIEPPSEVAADHDALVAGVRDMADAVDLLVDAQLAATEDPAEAKRLARAFATDRSFGAVEAAASNLEAAGVDAGL